MMFSAIRLALLCSVPLLLEACVGRDSGNTATPTIDTSVVAPAVLERLQEEGEAPVTIGLRSSGIPLPQETLENTRTQVTTVQDSVLSVLTEEDFRLTHQFPITPALGGYITMSGVEKLAGHTDVRFIELGVAPNLPSSGVD